MECLCSIQWLITRGLSAAAKKEDGSESRCFYFITKQAFWECCMAIALCCNGFDNGHPKKAPPPWTSTNKLLFNVKHTLFHFKREEKNYLDFSQDYERDLLFKASAPWNFIQLHSCSLMRTVKKVTLHCVERSLIFQFFSPENRFNVQSTAWMCWKVYIKGATLLQWLFNLIS